MGPIGEPLTHPGTPAGTRYLGEMDLDATLSGRERINSLLLETLDGATDPWGVKVSRVEIRRAASRSAGSSRRRTSCAP